MAALVLAGCNPAADRSATPASEAAASGVAAEAAPLPSTAVEPAAPAPSTPPSPTALPQRWQALGTEPFWAVEVTPGEMRWSTPENIPGTTVAARETAAGAARVWHATLDGQRFELRITPGPCSDGMSDTVYPFTAQVLVAGETRRGCARLRPDV